MDNQLTLVAPPETDIAKANPSFHEQLLNNLYDGVYFVDADRKITYWNQGAERLTGYSSTQAVGRHCYDNFLVHVNDKGDRLCFSGCPLASTLVDGERRECRVHLRHMQGHRVPISARISPIRNTQGEITGAVEVFSDVTAQVQYDRRTAELERLAFHDFLTRAYNRRFIELKVKESINEINELDRRFAVLEIDIDHFKQVNDVHGHAAGDHVLKAITKTMRSCLRSADYLARWGGEEFLVLLADASEETMTEIALRSCKFVAASPVPVLGHEIDVTISVGGTMLRAGDTLGSVTKRVDALMYESKTAGRNRVTCG